ncbi:MAG: M61 family metallopeptidase [Leadbetterella sp.]
MNKILSTLHVVSFCFLVFSCKATKPHVSMKDTYSIQYQVSMPAPSTHYFEVQMKVNTADLSQDFIDLKMPVWTPGSYLVREFSRHIESLSATSGEKSLKVRKMSKNTWRVEDTKNKEVIVKYKVYANELSVRTSHLDDSHGYINGASVFLYIKELMNKSSSIQIVPHSSFKKVSVALDEIGKFTYESPNYDLLVDSFFEIGNHEILTFDYENVKHTIANYSPLNLNYKKEDLINTYKDVVKASHSVFGGKHPCKNYLFVVHHLPGIGGGLEHLNGTTCQTSPDAYDSQESFVDFMGLIAHEYFHLWNVKRMRPEALGPFDYENENYTNMLWVSEGFTAFYQEDICKRAGLHSNEAYLATIQKDINTVENTPGAKVLSAAEASFDAWIKYYRPNENSNNSSISYYTKGSVIGGVLNALIIGETKGNKSLDDVFQFLYNEYYLKQDRGFTDKEFVDAVEKVCGNRFQQFFDDCVYGVKAIDYKDIYEKIGLSVNIKKYDDKPEGYAAVNKGGIIVSINRGASLYESGLTTGDLIKTVDGKAFKNIS